MTPNGYLKIVVMPTVKEFLVATGDRRLAYLSCQAAFHLCDYIRRANAKSLGDVRKSIHTLCPIAFEIVEGIANGSKHCGRDQGAYRHMPGTERKAEAFFADHSFCDLDRLEIPGLEVEHAGETAFIDECLRSFLLAAAHAFPAAFNGIDISRLERDRIQ